VPCCTDSSTILSSAGQSSMPFGRMRNELVRRPRATRRTEKPVWHWVVRAWPRSPPGDWRVVVCRAGEKAQQPAEAQEDHDRDRERQEAYRAAMLHLRRQPGIAYRLMK
jgi:hypothetical protein